MKENNKLKLIERYLAGEMNAQEQKAFREKLKSDEELRELLELDQDIDVAIENIDLVKTRQLLERLREKSDPDKEKEAH